jgi:hypothetical protein
MAPEMALNIVILLAIVRVAVLAAITGMALLVLAVVLRVWRKCYGGTRYQSSPTSTKSSCASTHRKCFTR